MGRYDEFSISKDGPMCRSYLPIFDRNLDPNSLFCPKGDNNLNGDDKQPGYIKEKKFHSFFSTP